MTTAIFPDTNISPKFFEGLPNDQLLVRTMFASIQGEGPLAGQPCVFVRLGGCNLGAKGVGASGCDFCDTDFRLNESRMMTFHKIQSKAEQLIGRATERVSPDGNLFIFTGGEPTLQKNLFGFLEQTTWRAQVESNGMYHLEMPRNSRTIMVISPKMGGATRYPPLNPKVLGQADCLKFVLDSDPLSLYHEVAEYAYTVTCPVYVSPMAVYRREMSSEEGERVSAWNDDLIDREATARNYEYAGEYALRNGLRLSIQSHLFANMP